ncbi:MAG: SDR family NAD(P)-dependent oxidoreductase [Arenimonas sp.]|nr:SDR family NAD(P)-dependent oxidoreductase [Arenimonas sp.]MBP6626425.1 SDR family NAD(P)-dependent oxidoreductase [Arenimonas sp.]
MVTWIVTGASRGLGRQLALALAARGHRVLACARPSAALAAMEREGAPGRIVAVPLDLADAAAVAPAVSAMVAAHGPIAGLVNNAGIGSYKPFLEHDEAELLRILQVNLGAVMQLCRALLPHFLAQGSGQIITIGSDLARRPLANMAAYVASKHGLAGFSHSLLREVKDRGVRVSLVNPGIIDTGFGGSGEDGPGSDGRLAPAQLAALVMHLVDAPAGLVLDEVTVHPVAQSDF